MTAFPNYTTGTVAVTNGGTVINGTGTIWSGVNARPGDDIVIGGNTVIVQDVTDTTHLVIDPWPYTTVAPGAAYKIVQRSPLRFAGGDAMKDVSTLVAALNTDGFYVFVPSTATVPDPSYGNNGQYAFQATTGKLWVKSAGVWTYLGIYKAFGTPAPWSAATAYSANDVATLAGSSYVCILAHTNQTPPNATYWAVLASIGATGLTGAIGASYAATSTTSFLIGTGSKAFTTQAGLAYQNGARVRASSNANTSNWMEGLATYSGTTLTINVDKINGSGTLADWNLNLAGQPGAGDLSSANNLSDVANKTTAKDNLSVHGADIASAATVNLETATGDLVDVTGTVTITAITLSEGHERTVRFTGALTLTNGASLVLPGGANITTAAGDLAIFRGYAAGVVRCVGYTPAAGQLSLGSQSLTTAQKQQAQSNLLLAPTITKLLSGSGTYTTPTGCTRIRVRMVGGGGGGQGSGSASRGVGGAGGNTTFGTSLLAANGGAGGSDAQSANGGTSSGGDINLTGGAAVGSFTSTGGSFNGMFGAASPFGGVGSGGVAGGAGSAAAANTGSGGGGGGVATAINVGGGGGAGGYLEKTISSPSATYSYAVGAGGTAGTAGTSGAAGGAGGSGLIIIEEFYGS
jgi:hypothetical protein